MGIFGKKKTHKDSMGLFGEASSPFDEILEKVTAEHLNDENWGLILDVCDRVNSDPKAPKLALLSIKKRLNNRDPHVILLALSVLDSCWSNCGPAFRREVSSSAFISELTSKATHSSRQIGEKTRIMIKKWTENECKTDSSLSLINSMYRNLMDDGYSFESSEPQRKKQPISDDPNVVSSQEEEDAIAKAIALSLEEDKKKSNKSGLYPMSSASNSNGYSNNNGTQKSNVPQLYPSLGSDFNLPRACSPQQRAVSPCPSSVCMPAKKISNNRLYISHQLQHDDSVTKSERVVRALYDFEAAEDNELSFVAGDLITVHDDSNPNWWSGRIGVQQGLFPASFVTSDLAVPKEETPAQAAEPVPTIDESVLLKCIQLLEDCDPTGEIPDSPELREVEQAAMAQAPLIDARLAAIDKQSNALAQVDIAIRDVLALYDQAVQQANPYQQMHMYAPVPQNTVHPPAITQQQQQYASQYMQNPMMQPAGAPNYQYQQQAPVPMQGAQPQYAPYPTFAQPQDWQAQQQQPIQPGVPSSAHNPY